MHEDTAGVLWVPYVQRGSSRLLPPSGRGLQNGNDEVAVGLLLVSSNLQWTAGDSPPTVTLNHKL